MRLTAAAMMLGLLLGCSQKTSDEYIASGKQFSEQQQYDAAVVELKNAVLMAPESAQARFELGRVYVLQKNFDAAEKELNRALDYGYPASQVIPLLTQAYQRTGALSALSEVDHKQAGLSATEQAKVGFFKLQSLVQLDKQDDAKALIEELEKLDTQSVYRGLALAYGHILDNNIEQALASAESLRQQSPLNQDVLRFQGRLLLQQGQTAEASDVYSTYVEENPDDNEAAFLLARILVEQGRMEEAEPIIDKLMGVSTENALLNHLKAIVRASEDDFQNAQSFAEKAITLGRGDPVLRLVAGYSAFQLKDHESANRHLSYIASSLPDNHPGLRMLAASQLQLGLSVEAGDVLNRIDDVGQQDALLFSKTGYELIRSGNLKQARDVVERSEDISSTAEDLTRLGVLKLSLNDIDGILDLEKALQQAPQLDSTKSTLATAYLATGQLDKAAELAAQWKASAPNDTKAYMLAGEVLSKQENYPAAKQEFEAILALEPDNLLARLALSNIAFLQGDNAEGEKGLSAIIAGNPDFVPALASFYLHKKRAGDGQAGLKPARQAWQKTPQNAALSTLLARMYLSEGEMQKAVDTLEQITADESAPASFWFIKGQALLRNNLIQAAEEHYDAWLSFSPNNLQATMGKLLLLDSQNQFSEALSLTDSFLEKRDDVKVSMLRTHFLTMTGAFDEAQLAYDALPEEMKNVPTMKSVKARLMATNGEFREALPLAGEVYEAIPNSRNLLLLVAILEQLEQDERAYAILSQHVEKRPQDVAAKMLLAERQISKQESDAIATYEASLKLNPDNFVVLNNLAYLYLQEGKVAQAKKHAERAVELQPEHPATLDTLAQVLVAEENYDDAIRYYDRISSDGMKNEEIYLNYVEALLANKQTVLAKRKLASRTLTEAASQQRLEQLKQQYGI